MHGDKISYFCCKESHTFVMGGFEPVDKCEFYPPECLQQVVGSVGAEGGTVCRVELHRHKNILCQYLQCIYLFLLPV
jgi:hypothetical protein